MNEKLYTYWLFYKIKNQKYQEIEPELYAYTDNKEYAKTFAESRDNQIFKRKKHMLSKNDVTLLAHDYQSQYLTCTDILFYDKIQMQEFKVPMVLTTTEKITVLNRSTQLTIEEIYNYCWTDPFIFNHEIQKALRILEYINVYRTLTRTIHNSSDFDDKVNLKADELGVFLHYFGYTMKK